MGHWSLQTAYTAIEFEGTLPHDVSVVSRPVEIQQSPEAEEQIDLSFVLSTLRPAAADITEWNDPPHVEFVNRSFETEEDVKQFVESYGFSQRWGADELEADGETVALEKIRMDQNHLRQLWGKADQVYSLKLIEGADYRLQDSDIGFVNGEVHITITDIWKYICSLFLIDASAGRLKKCANSDCRLLKYFVKSRRDQQFCSTNCKNRVHMAAWLDKPPNRESWNASRRQARLTKSERLKKSTRYKRRYKRP